MSRSAKGVCVTLSRHGNGTAVKQGFRACWSNGLMLKVLHVWATGSTVQCALVMALRVTLVVVVYVC